MACCPLGLAWRVASRASSLFDPMPTEAWQPPVASAIAARSDETNAATDESSQQPVTSA